MVDLDRVHERLETLGSYLRELRRLRDLQITEYLRHEVFAGRYLIQVSAQTCIDLANHVIDDGLPGRLRGLAGLRNRLVHVYDEIDDRRVHEALATGLDDLDSFATAIARLAT